MISPGTIEFRNHIQRRYRRGSEQMSEYLNKLGRELNLKSPRRMHDLYYDTECSFDVDEHHKLFTAYPGETPAKSPLNEDIFARKVEELEQTLTEIRKDLERERDQKEKFKAAMDAFFAS